MEGQMNIKSEKDHYLGHGYQLDSGAKEPLTGLLYKSIIRATE